ncbi:MAG: Lrp/AsnC family transcriptional regulator [Thermoanaerobaculia bacterium]
MSDKLDVADLAILDILTRDGRASISTIAHQVGLSRPTVAERIERMEASGVLRGITAAVDPVAIGREITAFIFAHSSASDASMKRMFRSLADQGDVLEIHTVAGEDCYVMKVRTDSIASLNTLVSSLQSPPFSLTTRTTIVLETQFEKVGGISIQDPA